MSNRSIEVMNSTQYLQQMNMQLVKLPDIIKQTNVVFAAINIVTEILELVHSDIQLYPCFQNIHNMYLMQYVKQTELEVLKYNVFTFYTNYNFEITVTVNTLHYCDSCDNYVCNVQYKSYNKQASLVDIIRFEQQKMYLYAKQTTFELACTINALNGITKQNKDVLKQFIKNILNGSKSMIHPKVYLELLHFNNNNEQILQYFTKLDNYKLLDMASNACALEKQNDALRLINKTSTQQIEEGTQIILKLDKKINDLKQQVSKLTTI
jgi:hypothetical protein